MSFFIHSSAIVEENVQIGPGTRVWDNVHIRHSAFIGSECIIGEKTHISYAVRIGNRVKINALVYICTGVEIEDGVMLSAGVIFTNDRFPRAATPDLTQLLSSAPDESTESTHVQEGATIGAGAVIGPGITIGRFATIGMGSVVTHDVPAFHLCYGNPARSCGLVCRCGFPLRKFEPATAFQGGREQCRHCGQAYLVAGDNVVVCNSPALSNTCENVLES